jgi:hypothetical protein
VLQVKMQWDDSWLWVGAWLQEPQLVATITEKNSVIYHDNDFEVGAVTTASACGCERESVDRGWDVLVVRSCLWVTVAAARAWLGRWQR